MIKQYKQKRKRKIEPVITICEDYDVILKRGNEYKEWMESIAFIGPDGRPLPEPTELPKDTTIDYNNDRGEEE
jgi:hypothetical protein